MLLALLLIVSTVQAEDWVYKVRKGDNLWNLTVDHLIDLSYVEKVRTLNDIADPWHILPGTVIRIPSTWIRHYPALVRVASLHGTAELWEDGATLPKPLIEGAIVMLGDSVATGPGSSLVLVFLDGSRIMLQENSRLTIDRLMLLEYTGMSDSRLQLERGRLETQVTPNSGSVRRFQIKTPATVTSVRGTDYRLAADATNDESRTEVVAGKVDVSGGGQKRLLKAGFGAVIGKGKAPSAPLKLLPAPDASGIPAVFSQVPLQFAMPGSEPERGYRVQIAANPEFDGVLFDRSYTSTIIRGPDLPDGSYYIRVRAIDRNRLEGLNAQLRFAVNARPEAPFPVSPQPGQGVLQETPTLNWARLQGDLRYHVQVAADPEFSDVVFDRAEIADNETTLTEPLPIGKYYWRVAAIDREGDGPFSDGQLLRRIPPAPELDAADISEQTLMIRSRGGLPGQTFHFQMAEDEEFSELLVDQRTEQPGFEIPRPDAGEYFVRVRTIDPDGFIGPFGAPQTVDVPYDNPYWFLLLLPLFALFAL